MFRASIEPLMLSEAGMHGLRLSLNAPVVNVPEVPVGPARAAIVLFAGEYGALRLGLGLRSVESGATALYLHGEEVDAEVTAEEAMDTALGFAERMGFLFDEDLVARAGRPEALQRWRELMGDERSPADAAAPAVDAMPPAEPLDVGALEADAAPAELLLDDVAELEIDDHSGLPSDDSLSDLPAPALEIDAETPTPAEDPGAAPRATLTKFRRLDAQRARAKSERRSSAGRRASDAGPNELGRIPIVRKRLAPETASRPSALMRLLSQF